MDGLLRFFLGRMIFKIAILVFAVIVVLFCQLIDVKIERHGNKTYFVRKHANSMPPWVSVAAFGGVAGLAFLALRFFAGGKKPAAPPPPSSTQSFPTQIRRERDRDIDRALVVKPRPPERKDST
jgi:hypothetical protein